MSKEKKEKLQEETADNGQVEEIFAEGEEKNVDNETEQPVDQETLQQQLDEANKTIKELTAKAEEMENRYLRLQADFDNARRRAKLDLEAARKYRVQSLAAELLQSLDNFERALSVQTANEEAASILQGLDMVYRGIVNALKQEGVEPIEAVGKEFDPNLHQAVMQVNEEDAAPNTVVEELQKGYMLKDRVLRPSMVKVNQ
ncbi:nucleotide exchange factor GrpE [Bacillus testis]|uniref:nucleotide exchange factor GrpE n=1 Tax=Bacillus testis TaxID=1622072 RepID=UPI00067E90B9|nr:nucleotide exchange factor GrpE [Bacillus testis]